MIEKISKYRKELFGISTIAIVLFHIGTYTNLLPSTWLVGKIVSLIFEVGNSGVDIFLLLSAIGLTYSLKKNTLPVFYLNRIKRTFVPYLLFTLFYFIWYDFFALKDGLLQYSFNVLTLNYFIVGPGFPLWFIPFIMVMYLLFPIIDYINNKSKLYTVLIAVLIIVVEFLLYLSKSDLYTKFEIPISRIPAFLFGVLIANSKISFSKKYNLFLLPVGFISLFSYYLLPLPEMFNRFLLFIFAFSMVVLYITLRELYKIDILGKINSYIGGFSLEIYVSNVLFIQIIKYYNLWKTIPSALWYLIIPLVALLVSLLVSKIVGLFLKKI